MRSLDTFLRLTTHGDDDRHWVPWARIPVIFVFSWSTYMARYGDVRGMIHDVSIADIEPLPVLYMDI